MKKPSDYDYYLRILPTIAVAAAVAGDSMSRSNGLVDLGNSIHSTPYMDYHSNCHNPTRVMRSVAVAVVAPVNTAIAASRV